MRLSLVVPDSTPKAKIRLDLFLSRETGESRTFIKSQILKGRVEVNGIQVKEPSHLVSPGDKITGETKEPAAPDLVPIAANLDILYEDESLLALNKPQGLVMHPAPGHRGETLVHYLLHHLKSSTSFSELTPGRPGIVHRLDRGTSGVVIVAKNRKALESLAEQFKSRKVKKIYEGIVWGTMKTPEGSMRTAVGRDSRDRKKMSSRTQKGREALTKWKVVSSFGSFTLLELSPHTGRTHQLRVHLTEAGHPLVGDDLYGVSSRSRRLASLPELSRDYIASLTQTLLHARELNFFHPITQEPIQITAPRPKIFEETILFLQGLGP